MGGGSDVHSAANKLGLPADLVEEAENFRHSGEGIYPDNMQTVGVFRDLMTQWRVGMSGLIGLDYNVIPVVFRLRRIPKAEQQEVFDGIQVMERAAIRATQHQ